MQACGCIKWRRKKTGIFAGSFHLVEGLNGRDCDTEDQGYQHTGSNERGDHGPIIFAFNAERLSILILWHAVRPPLFAFEWRMTIGAP